MLPKRRRLSAAEVREVLARGRGSRGKVLSLKFLPTTEPFACAAVVPKKVAKTATKRNTLRRALYRALSTLSLPPTGHAILFMQTVPKENLSLVLIEDIKKLLHV